MRAVAAAAAAVAALVAPGCGGSPSVPGADRPPAPTATHARAAPPPATDPASVATRATVPVLCYHLIRRPTAADSPRDRTYIVSPAVLARHMDALAEAGYTTITGDALVAHVARAAPLPRRPVLLTFDDASKGQITHALPILRRRGLVATFFVMTVVLGQRGWMSRDDVRTLDRAGMTIGAHTWDHHAVTGYGDADWPRQVDEPVRDLQSIVGHPVRLFAYPYGLWSPAAFAHLRGAGLTAAFQLSAAMDQADPLMTLRRIIVPEWSRTRLLREIDQDF
jgi:peptidoglycan/xylan/chitin deacetylase (PgdA/CDA1 family)